jgi:NodT family efflux transporter outer membrane factor (OMF) lipoprotein
MNKCEDHVIFCTVRILVLEKGLCVKKYNLSALVFMTYIVGSLAGCVNYIGINSNKKMASPAQYSINKSIPHQHGHWPKMDWGQQFGDPQLPHLINEALANNPSLHAAQARIVQARALAESRASVLLPAVSLQTLVDRGRISQTVLPRSLALGTWFTFSGFLSKINYELDIWGKNVAAYKQALSEEKVSDTSNQQARLVIATGVASAYNQLAYYYSLRDILRRTVSQRQALDKIASIRLRNGLDTEVQLNQSRNTTANAQTQLLDVEGQIILTRQQLGTLLGSGADRGLTIKNPQLNSIKTPQLPAELPLHLLGRRPDIVGARWSVEASCQGVKNVKAKFYPDINIGALAGFLSFGTSRLFERASAEYQIGPALTLPIFDAGNLRAQLRGEYGLYEEAVANYNNVLNNALSDVANQITAIHSTDLQLHAQKQSLYTSKRAYDLARYQYRTGLASQLVVFDAETLFLDAQTKRLQLITAQRNRHIVLIKALGGGFDASCHTPTPKDK